MASLFARILSFGQEDKKDSSSLYPPDKFAIVETTNASGKPMVGSFNQSYKDFVDKSKYTWCLKIYIGLEVKNCKENGLATEPEIKIANDLEEELLKKIRELTIAHNVGHFFTDTFLDIFIYINDPDKIHQYLQTQVNKKELVRPFGYRIEMDPAWSSVMSFIQ